MASGIPAAPPGTRAAGRRLWRSIVEVWELDAHERALLVEAVRTVDVLDELEQTVRDDGAMIDTQAGPKPHPAAVEARQQRLTLARLLAALRLPDAPGEKRPRRPSGAGARGAYAMRGPRGVA